MGSSERCTVIQCAFGSRDPLPPRVASLGVEPSIPSIGEIDKANPGDEHDTDVKTLGTCTAITSGLQPSASTPASGPNNQRKWSHVVAFGSKEPPAKITTRRLKAATPYSVLLAITLIADLLDVLMLNCPDFPTLFALVATCTATKHAFERHSQGIIKAVLEKMPQELQYLTVALIGINGSQIDGSRSIRMLMETWLGMGPKPLSKRLQVCTSVASSFSFKTPT